MNPYTKNINRIEFPITFACTGRCKHCSQGEHTSNGEHIDGDISVKVIYKICSKFNIESLMTFGGEPLLYSDDVCKIHTAAQKMNIKKRQLITNGFFSKDEQIIKDTSFKLAQSGINEIALSVDAFHQETIPLNPVKAFAKAVKNTGISIHTHPAWLVNKEAQNPYNQRTLEILKEFEHINILASDGNDIFPSGNALKYFKEYFDLNKEYLSPYTENPEDIHTLSIKPNGDVLGKNIYKTDILDIIENYIPNN